MSAYARRPLLAALASSCIFAPSIPLANTLEEVTVQAGRVANSQAATSLASIATSLAYDPQVEIYSRGLAEGQADITVRGSMFESTSVKVGAVVLMDPQTGHYTANLPISPELLTFGGVLTGAQNAVEGFNATVATLSYNLDISEAARRVSLSSGSDRFNSQSALYSQNLDGQYTLAVAAERSEGDGTIDNGDHHFQRINLAVQRDSGESQSALILASQHQFFGWPGAYTGFATLPETDHTDTDLLLFNHQQGDTRVGGYYRRVVDNYDFDRRTYENGVAGAFEHETASYGVAIEGERDIFHYRAQWTGDKLVSSTDLTHGNFTSRQYLTGSLGVRQQQAFSDGTLQYDIGLSSDISSRDSDTLQPYAYFEWQPASSHWAGFVDYARTSQLPGYTALQSGTSGLFGGNPELSRERAEHVELGVKKAYSNGQLEASIFWRGEQNVVDWTYASQSPYARQANAMDNDVSGAQFQASLQRDALWLRVGVTLLNKDFQYATDLVDASYYALNYAKLRSTVAAQWQVSRQVALQLDTEYRKQAPNTLRRSSREAFFARLSTVWTPSVQHQFSLLVDNLSDDDFQMYPGTPGMGRSASLSYDYRW